jgi:hypothetical protein
VTDCGTHRRFLRCGSYLSPNWVWTIANIPILINQGHRSICLHSQNANFLEELDRDSDLLRPLDRRSWIKQFKSEYLHKYRKEQELCRNFNLSPALTQNFIPEAFPNQPFRQKCCRDYQRSYSWFLSKFSLRTITKHHSE